MVVAAGLKLLSATVDGTTITLTYIEILDSSVTLPLTAFTVHVNGASRPVSGVSVSGLAVTLTLAAPAGDAVTVGYTRPEGSDFIRDIQGRMADSFDGRAVTNDTAPVSLMASAHSVPASHDGSSTFTFELRFSAEFPLNHLTLRDNDFTVTGGTVTGTRQLEPGKNARWEVTVQPDSEGAVIIVLPVTEDCASDGAICTDDGKKLSAAFEITVSGPGG